MAAAAEPEVNAGAVDDRETNTLRETLRVVFPSPLAFVAPLSSTWAWNAYCSEQSGSTAIALRSRETTADGHVLAVTEHRPLGDMPGPVAALARWYLGDDVLFVARKVFDTRTGEQTWRADAAPTLSRDALWADVRLRMEPGAPDEGGDAVTAGVVEYTVHCDVPVPAALGFLRGTVNAAARRYIAARVGRHVRLSPDVWRDWVRSGAAKATLAAMQRGENV
jgi:hypothetical protein